VAEGAAPLLGWGSLCIPPQKFLVFLKLDFAPQSHFCVHDPKRYAKFQALATPLQREAKDYFSTVIKKNYFV
jgi:hypothetical protein